MTPICLPFTRERALAKVPAAEDAWNSRDPERVSLSYSEDTEWRNRSEFLRGRVAVRVFWRRKWQTELGYRLKKELWTFGGDRLAVRFEYEWHDDTGQWYRSYGNEMWALPHRRCMVAHETVAANDGACLRRLADFGPVLPGGGDVRQRQEPRAQEGHARATVHLASNGLQPIDMAFHRTIAPRLGDRAFDGVEVVSQLADEALQRTDAGRVRPRQPSV